jgi:glycerol-3-phosphate dehydrogenase
MPHCIEDTGGFFVQTPSDEPDYAQKFLDGCRTAGIPVEEISIRDMLAEEALLNPAITRCFRVPDGAADSFLGAHANVRSAQEHGAGIFNYHPVVELIQDGKRVAGAHCRDLIHDEDILIRADMVVNAAGAWSGIIAGMTGIALTIIPGKGVMIAANHRLVNTVVNRCHMPADGDILVPAHTVAIIGTTDVRVEDPEHYGIEPWERRLMLEEGEKLIPGFKDMRMLRAWAGVRPLYQEAASGSDSNRDVTRAFVLLDHESRDGVTGLITITSGKWTTYRKMAEVTVDLVCKKLGTQRDCRTHLEALPGQEDGHYHSLGARLEAIEKEKTYGQLICECELATYAQVEKAILEGAANTLDDIRRDVRLGMGPCQAGFCTLRAAGMLRIFAGFPARALERCYTGPVGWAIAPGTLKRAGVPQPTRCGTIARTKIYTPESTRLYATCILRNPRKNPAGCQEPNPKARFPGGCKVGAQERSGGDRSRIGGIGYRMAGRQSRQKGKNHLQRLGRLALAYGLYRRFRESTRR